MQTCVGSSCNDSWPVHGQRLATVGQMTTYLNKHGHDMIQLESKRDFLNRECRGFLFRFRRVAMAIAEGFDWMEVNA